MSLNRSSLGFSSDAHTKWQARPTSSLIEAAALLAWEQPKIRDAIDHAIALNAQFRRLWVDRG